MIMAPLPSILLSLELSLEGWMSPFTSALAWVLAKHSLDDWIVVVVEDVVSDVGRKPPHRLGKRVDALPYPLRLDARVVDRRRHASRCGFSSIRNFNRVFRKITSYSPKSLPENYDLAKAEARLFPEAFDPTEKDSIRID